MIFFMLFGLIVGSFVNVLIYRVPRNLNWYSARSACPNCQNKIYWYYNIPIFSYFFLNGKCKFCAKKISLKYPFVELIVGIASASFFYYYLADSINIYYNSTNVYFPLNKLLDYLFYFSVFCLFLTLLFIDLEFHLLPDGLNLLLFIIITVYSVFHYSWEHWLIGGLVGFLGPLSITYIFFKIKGQIGLGGGDIKLYGILGILFGPFIIVQTLCLSSIMGLVFALVLISFKKMRRDQPFAFGPSIIVVAFCQIHFPELMSNPFTHLLIPI